MKLKIEIIRLLNLAIIRCEGRITYGPEASRLQETVERLLAECDSCILNLEGVTQVDARGLGTLAELVRQTRARHSSFSLSNVNGRVRGALQLTRLDEVLDIIYASEQAAVEHRVAA